MAYRRVQVLVLRSVSAAAHSHVAPGTAIGDVDRDGGAGQGVNVGSFGSALSKVSLEFGSRFETFTVPAFVRHC